MYRYVLSSLQKSWGKHYNEYVNFCNTDVEKAVEVIVLTLRDAVAVQSFEIEGSELSEKNIEKNWLQEVVQKQEFVQLARKEAVQRKRRRNRENFKIAVEAVVACLRTIYKDLRYRAEKNKRTYAKFELISLVSSLPVSLENDIVSKKTLKMLGFADAQKTNLETFSELYTVYKMQKQKTFLIANLVSGRKRKRKKTHKSKKTSYLSEKQLSLLSLQL